MRALPALLLFVFAITPTSSPAAPVVTPERCEVAKLLAGAGAALQTVRCHAAAVRAGLPVDPTCVAAATTRLAAGFARAETRPPCVATNDAPGVGAVLTTLGDDLAVLAGGAASRCDARTLAAAAKLAKAALKAQAAHAKAPEEVIGATALARAHDVFDRLVASAGLSGDCTTADGASVGARVDAAVDAVVDLVRGTLRSLAAQRSRTIGAAVRANLLAAPTQGPYRSTVLRQLGALTAEYEFMWGNMEPTRGQRLLGPIDTVVDFGEQHGLPVKGAPLVWHLILPPWITESMSAAELQAAVDERIDFLMGTYAGRVATWDVVNEAVNDGGPGFRDSIFLRKLGTDYIRAAFVRARQADPSALLFYNDFLADGLNPKSDFIYDMVVGLLAAGAPIDGVSFQMHLGGGFGPTPTRESIRQNLARFAALGLIVRISEMDVQVRGEAATYAGRMTRQRAIYHDVLAACLDVPACDSISFWGVGDAHTWVSDYLHVYDEPLPFDRAYQPKAAFFGARDALAGY